MSAAVPEPAAPHGYVVRGFLPGDEEAWCGLLGAGGELGGWDVPRLRRVMDGGLVVKTQRFVVAGPHLVACAGIYDRCCGGFPAWEIGYVATHPGWRERGLGIWVTTAAIAACRQLSPRPLFLLTDDFRLPAIKLYLRLGFVPDCTLPGMTRRWLSIRGKLGQSGAVLLDFLPSDCLE